MRQGWKLKNHYIGQENDDWVEQEYYVLDKSFRFEMRLVVNLARKKFTGDEGERFSEK